MSAPEVATARIATEHLTLQIWADPSLSQNLVTQPHGDPLLKTAKARACPVDVVLPGRRLAGGDFSTTSIYEAKDAVIATCAAEGVELRLTWSRAPAEALRLLVQARIAGDTPVDGEARLTILDHLHPGDLDRTPGYDAGRGPLTRGGRPLVRAGHYALPRVWWDRNGEGGVAVLGRIATPAWDVEPWRWVTPPDTIPIRLRPEWLDICELTFMACGPEWHSTVAALREQIRAEIDFDEYRRPDFSWYREQWVQHFTFMYGREVFDHTRGYLDADRLLDEGQRFGGYDGVLLWPAYPRIGVDERSQWDFYDDVPGGRDGLRAFAARAHQRGTRVFIPYLPWDAPGECRHGEPPLAGRELARVIADIDADGVFLDTLGAVLPQFRREIDRVRTGIVFCSEIQPGLRSLNQITGSWDQGEHPHVGEIDLLRFLVPEHPSFMINRFAIGAHREGVIARALFNGTGLVIWQDVFGEVLPYTDAEAALACRTITTLRRHAECFRGAEALPLVPTQHQDIYANAFVAADGRAVVTVYNDGDQTVHGDLLAWTHNPQLGWSEEVIGDAGGRGRVHDLPHGTIEPGRVATFTTSPIEK